MYSANITRRQHLTDTLFFLNNMAIKGIGVDIVEINRFRKTGAVVREQFIANNFSERERLYIFSHTDWATHLAGSFAAKESVVKALGGARIVVASVEIVRDKVGRPLVYVDGRYRKDILTTISHSGKVAIAFSIYT